MAEEKKSPLFTENLAKLFRDTMEAEGIKLPKKKRKPKEEDPEVYVMEGKKLKRIKLDDDKKKKPKKKVKLVWSKKKEKTNGSSTK